jgi:4-amino-4-deoxy-L-arabinose transferase-like glycosyltransferase
MAVAGLSLIVLLGALLRFYKLGAYSIGNAYYAATVKSMLISWHNFLFAAYEPGGSVTVDKPPLGFWLQAASACLLGVNGFALALPQALAGTLSIPLLYGLVRRQFGRPAGLVAALVLAVMPVAISTERNNTPDGLLVLVLLLAAWAFWWAARSGRLRDLLLGAVLVGLGFNIKMLQAFLPLPAFYLLYLLGARIRWWRRILYLSLATVVLLAVSLSWAIVIDLTPQENRPYVGSSENNTFMDLITGHNGIERLNSVRRLIVPLFGSEGTKTASDVGQPGSAPPPPGGRPGLGRAADQPGLRPAPPDNGTQGPPVAPGAPGSGLLRPPRPSADVGRPGWLRLVSEPLVDEVGWLLPVALLGIPLALVMLVVLDLDHLWPLSSKLLALVLWAGWLLPAVIYFSLNSALWHAYYLIMLGPPLAALVGITAWALWQLVRQWHLLGLATLALIAGVTLWVQFHALSDDPGYIVGVLVVAVPLLLASLILLGWASRHKQQTLARIALGLSILSLVFAPLMWSGLTALNENPDPSLPRSGPDTGQLGTLSAALSPAQEATLDFLLTHTDAEDYLVAGLSSQDVSGYIIETGRPALALGGFHGGDDVVTVEELAEMVAEGELRYILGGEGLALAKPEISHWVESTCSTVEVPSLPDSDPRQHLVLYDCGR